MELVRRKRESFRESETSNAKLTWEKVKEIRRKYRDGKARRGLQTQLAAEYGVSQFTINQVVHYRSWIPSNMRTKLKKAMLGLLNDELKGQ